MLNKFPGTCSSLILSIDVLQGSVQKGLEAAMGSYLCNIASQQEKVDPGATLNITQLCDIDVQCTNPIVRCKALNVGHHFLPNLIDAQHILKDN